MLWLRDHNGFQAAIFCRRAPMTTEFPQTDLNAVDLALQIKAINDDGSIEGLAAGYGNVDRGSDRIMPGAATKSLAERPRVPMLLYHDQTRPVGVWSALNESADGLHAKGRFAMSTTAGREAHALAKDGALAGLSIGFLPTQHKWAGDVRELHEIDVLEISLTPVPMNARAVIRTVKAFDSLRELDRELRGAGFPRSLASKMAVAGWSMINPDAPNPAIERLAAALRSPRHGY